MVQLRLVSAALTAVLTVVSPLAAVAATFSGQVLDAAGQPLAGVFVSAKLGHVTNTVSTGTDGAFALDAPAGEGTYQLRAARLGFVAYEQADASAQSGLQITLQRKEDLKDDALGSAFLAALPEGEEKRKLILDCMGCHPMNQRVVYKEGVAFDEAGYKASVDKMLTFSGASTMFPVMSPERESESTAKFLAAYLTDAALAPHFEACREAETPAGGYDVTEYDLPMQQDLPHDLMLDGNGRVLVTGMFTNQVYILDPGSGEFATEAIPQPGGNPRALDVASNGDWWMLGGMSYRISHYSATGGEWQHYQIGMYPHSIAVDKSGRAWFNGHFTKEPIQMGYVDSKSGETAVIDVPGIDGYNGSPIPYGLRVGDDGTVWSTELAGNRLIKYSPDSGEFKTYTLPSPHSGPRRPDVAMDGTVWIPEFSGGKIAHFDPATETFTEYDFPSSNSLPYCARIDHKRGYVWVSQCANDAIARVDMKTKEIVEYRLPTHIAFIRHLDIDQESGDVWAAYSHSPGIHPKIARLRVQ